MSKQKQQTAEAPMEMDDLNLDDLFLGGDGDGAMGGLGASGAMGGAGGGGGGMGSAIAASLFADMELDLGCIMDGIIGMEENDGDGGMDKTGFGSDSLKGMMMLDDDLFGENVDFDDGSSNIGAGGQMSRRRSSTNSIYSAGRGGGGTTSATTAGLNRKGKRTRTARSNPHHAAAAAMIQPQQRLHQSKEVASLAGSPASLTSAASVKSRRGDLSSLIMHSSRTKEAKIVHHRDSNQFQQQQQHQKVVLEQSSSSLRVNQYSYGKQQPQSQASGPILDGKQQEELRSLKVRKYEKSLSNYGLASSRTLFYPYMKLPTTALDCKIQRSQKSLYPTLDSFSAHLVPSPSSKGGEGGPADSIPITNAPSTSNRPNINHNIMERAPVSSSATPSIPSTISSSNTTTAVINLTSPVYSLFQHTPASSPSELIEMLSNSTNAVGSTLRNLETQRRGIIHHSVPSPKPPPFSSPSQIVDELVKIYLRHMRQSAFLRQNTINLENWCKDHFTNEDVRNVFPVDRKSLEQIFNSLWMHEKERVQRLQQSQQEQIRVGGRGGGRSGSTVTPRMISIDVKVKTTGWRDKSGTKLKATLACPKRWKVAMARGASASSTQIPSLDLSPFSTKTLDRAADEILMIDLLPPKKRSRSTVATTSSTSVEIDTHDTVLQPMKDNKTLGSGSASTMDNADGKKRRRRSKKDDVGSASPRSRGATSSDSSPDKKEVAAQLCSSRGSMDSSAFIPHIPGSSKPRSHRRNLPNETHDVDGGRAKRNSLDAIHKEGQRIVHALYNAILHPSVKPSQRRALLAEEVSLTLSRLNQSKRQRAHASQLFQPQSPSLVNKRRDQIQKQIAESQTAYLDDLALMPTTSNTLGMWKYLENCNYFEVLENEDDLSIALEGLYQPETAEVDDFENEDGGYYMWGSLPKTMDRHILEKDDVDDGSIAVETESPLFDQLQSLLVEVDGDEGVDNSDADYDDDSVIANLPPYSPDEFITGPKIGNGNIGKESDEYDEGDASALFDQSTLSLDQRTYIHICAARLVDSKWAPSHDVIPPTISPSSVPLSHTIAFTEATEHANDDPIDEVVQKMNSRLSNIRGETNSKIRDLRHMALSQV